MRSTPGARARGSQQKTLQVSFPYLARFPLPLLLLRHPATLRSDRLPSPTLPLLPRPYSLIPLPLLLRSLLSHTSDHASACLQAPRRLRELRDVCVLSLRHLDALLQGALHGQPRAPARSGVPSSWSVFPALCPSNVRCASHRTLLRARFLAFRVIARARHARLTMRGPSRVQRFGELWARRALSFILQKSQGSISPRRFFLLNAMLGTDIRFAVPGNRTRGRAP